MVCPTQCLAYRLPGAGLAISTACPRADLIAKLGGPPEIADGASHSLPQPELMLAKKDALIR